MMRFPIQYLNFAHLADCGFMMGKSFLE